MGHFQHIQRMGTNCTKCFMTISPAISPFSNSSTGALLWADVLKREVYLISAEEERVPGPLIKRDVVPLPVIAYRNSKEEAQTVATCEASTIVFPTHARCAILY